MVPFDAWSVALWVRPVRVFGWSLVQFPWLIILAARPYRSCSRDCMTLLSELSFALSRSVFAA